MEKESKFEIMTEDYWLVLTVCGNQLHVQVLIYACDKVGKFSSELSFSNENPLTFSFESPAQAIDFIKSGNNFEVDLTKKIFIMKWKVIGDRFQRNIIFPITLNNEKMTEVEELKCQNIILKRKLSALTKNTNDMPLEKNELKKKENEYCVKVQNKTPDQVMQKAVSDNKESIQIEISGSEFYKNKNSVIDNSENDETEQNKLKREKRKTIKKKEKKSIFQIIKAQKQKLSNLIPHQNPPKKRGRKKKCDQEAYKSYILNDNQIESTVSSANKVKISFANGDYYSGQILNNLYHGYGLYYSETNGKFQGNWENGRANGFGISVDPMGNRHSGFYIDDKRTGKGIDEYTNGEKYEGYFQEDCKSGLGKYIYQNGDFYEGFWKNDMYNGKGIQNYQDGSKYDGYWIDDQKDGEGIFITREGKKFLQVWIRGNKESEQQIY